MANLSSKIQGVSQAAMPVITPWVSFTPTGSWTTNTTYTGRWRRVGDTAQFQVNVAMAGAPEAENLTLDIPSSIGTIAGSSLLVTSSLSYRGSGSYFDSGSGRLVLQVFYNTDTSVTVLAQTSTGGAQPYLSQLSSTYPVTPASGDTIMLEFEVPIAGWESGTLQTANTYQVEYASNSDTSDADDTTSFVTGMSGSSFPGALTATRSKRVRFAGQIQASDRILIEVNDGNGWVDLAATIFTYNLENSTAAGITYSIVNSTEVDVNFSPYARLNGATFGAAGQAWTAFSTYKYRVRKVSGGIQGFGNATTTTPGLVTLNQLCPSTTLTDYVPVLSGITGGVTTRAARWRRYADAIDVEWIIDIGTVTGSGSIGFSLPYTMDDEYLNPSSVPVTTCLWYDASASGYVACEPIALSSTTIGIVKSASADRLTVADLASGDLVRVFVRGMKVKELAGSLPGLVSDAQVEFASTSGTWDAASSTTVYGASGSAMGGTLTASREKTVTWASAPGATDVIVVEGSKDQVNWFPINGCQLGSGNNPVAISYNASGDAISGVGTRPGASSNQTIVTFYQYMGLANDDIGQRDWQSSQSYWRVKKVKSSISALVDNATADSYGLVKGGKVPGATDGVAIAAGYVGEKVEVTGTLTPNTGAWVVSSALNIPSAGMWRVDFIFAAQNNANASTTNCLLNIGTGTSTSGTETIDSYTIMQAACNGTRGGSGIVTYYAALSGATTYYGKALAGGASFDSAVAYKLMAVRIA